MERQEDSFDGSFPDNIRSPAYKAQWANKKNKLVINVSGIIALIQTRSTQWSSTSPKRTNGSFKLTPSPTSTSTSAGLIITSSPISSPACSPTRRSTTFQVLANPLRHDHSFAQEQLRHCAYALPQAIPRRV